MKLHMQSILLFMMTLSPIPLHTGFGQTLLSILHSRYSNQVVMRHISPNLATKFASLLVQKIEY